MKSGIYSIMHISSGRFYIGSARDVSQRCSAHKSMLRRGTHHSPHLQHAWNCYGADAFKFSTIEHCEPDLLLEREQFWIDRLCACDPDRGFNTAPVAGTRFGVPQSVEARAKMSVAGKGKPKSAAHRAKIGAANKGKVRTEECKRRITATVSETMRTPERRALAAEYAKLGTGTKGKKMSPESRHKMSIAAKARCIVRRRGDDGTFL
jgi:group I intron endonuclease